MTIRTGLAIKTCFLIYLTLWTHVDAVRLKQRSSKTRLWQSARARDQKETGGADEKVLDCKVQYWLGAIGESPDKFTEKVLRSWYDPEAKTLTLTVGTQNTWAYEITKDAAIHVSQPKSGTVTEITIEGNGVAMRIRAPREFKLVGGRANGVNGTTAHLTKPRDDLKVSLWHNGERTVSEYGSGSDNHDYDFLLQVANQLVAIRGGRLASAEVAMRSSLQACAPPQCDSSGRCECFPKFFCRNTQPNTCEEVYALDFIRTDPSYNQIMANYQAQGRDRELSTGSMQFPVKGSNPTSYVDIQFARDESPVIQTWQRALDWVTRFFTTTDDWKETFGNGKFESAYSNLDVLMKILNQAKDGVWTKSLPRAQGAVLASEGQLVQVMNILVGVLDKYGGLEPMLQNMYQAPGVRLQKHDVNDDAARTAAIDAFIKAAEAASLLQLNKTEHESSMRSLRMRSDAAAQFFGIGESAFAIGFVIAMKFFLVGAGLTVAGLVMKRLGDPNDPNDWLTWGGTLFLRGAGVCFVVAGVSLGLYWMSPTISAINGFGVVIEMSPLFVAAWPTAFGAGMIQHGTFDAGHILGGWKALGTAAYWTIIRPMDRAMNKFGDKVLGVPPSEPLPNFFAAETYRPVSVPTAALPTAGSSAAMARARAQQPAVVQAPPRQVGWFRT